MQRWTEVLRKGVGREGGGGWRRRRRRNDGQLSGVIGEQQCMCWLQIDVGAGSSPKAVNMLSGRREIN